MYLPQTNRLMKKITTFFALFFLPFLAFGQYGDIGAYYGLAVLKGETVHKTISLEGAGSTCGAIYRRPIGQKFGLKGSIGFGSYKGDDAFYPGESGRRNFKFKTNFIDASAVAEFSFSKKGVTTVEYFTVLFLLF